MTAGLIHMKETKVKLIVGEMKILLHYKLAITTQDRVSERHSREFYGNLNMRNYLPRKKEKM